MGRGLSDLQKRILEYAADNYCAMAGGAGWFTSLRPEGQKKIADVILPGHWGNWTDSDTASVSRALRRTEARGLIVRSRGYHKRRTDVISLTPAGAAMVKQSRVI